eukprot:841881-Pyramimonas_sp.AAC.1
MYLSCRWSAGARAPTAPRACWPTRGCPRAAHATADETRRTRYDQQIKIHCPWLVRPRPRRAHLPGRGPTDEARSEGRGAKSRAAAVSVRPEAYAS